MNAETSVKLVMVAASGLGAAFLLRRFVTKSVGFTFSSARVTYFASLNNVCFWTVIVLTAFICVLLVRSMR